MAHIISAARLVAYDAFLAVMEQNINPEVFLQDAYRVSKIRLLDRRLIKEIVYGSLRWYYKIFWILAKTANKDLKKSTPEIRVALICGTYQIFYMKKIPDRVAVNESVEYVRHHHQAHATRFINGILRQIARRTEYFQKPDKATQAVEYLSLQFSHPEWIVRRWIKKFRFERLEKLLASNNIAPPKTVRVNSLKVSKEKIHEFQKTLLREEKIHSHRRPLRYCLHLDKLYPLENSLFQKGYMVVQDESSQLIAYLLNVHAKQRVYDICSAPGGKLTHIYELTKGLADIIAVDSSKSRICLLEEQLNRLEIGNHITVIQQDFLSWYPKDKADRLLLDVPCSGLGVLRRHPEGKWQKTLGIIYHHSKIQKIFLKHAWNLLKEGGELVYSVCSFEQEEVEEQIAWVKKEFKNSVEIVSPLPRLPDYYKKYVTNHDILSVFSGNTDNMDGFSAFILRKKSDILS